MLCLKITMRKILPKKSKSILFPTKRAVFKSLFGEVGLFFAWRVKFLEKIGSGAKLPLAIFDFPAQT